MIVGVDGLNMESKEFLFVTGDDKGKGGIGTKDIPKDVAEESKK